MKCQSTRFGTFEVSDDTLLVFPSGILGFPDWTKYVLLDHDTDAPFKWLQCVEEPQLAFVILDPALFKPDYQCDHSYGCTDRNPETGRRRVVCRHDFDHPFR